MGRNRDIRKKVVGRRAVIEKHEEKIRQELSRPDPDGNLVIYWRKEIEAREREIARLTRRLKREW